MIKKWNDLERNFLLRENKIYINNIIMLDTDEINTTLLVVLVLLVIFLIVIYFSVNYNQTQKANILNEKANTLSQKVSNLKMDCPRCPSLECPPEKECPSCNCPEAPRCPSCPSIPKPQKCPDLKCPELNISKDGKTVTCPECPSLKCPDVKCPEIPHQPTPPQQDQIELHSPQKILSEPTPSIVSATPPLRPTINEPPPQMIPPQPLPPVEPTPPPEPIIDNQIEATQYQPPRMIGDPLELKPTDLLPRGGHFDLNQSSFANFSQEAHQPPSYLNQVIGGMYSGAVRSINTGGPIISGGGYYPVQNVTEKCPIQGYKQSSDAPLSDTPARPSRTNPPPAKLNVQPANNRPTPTPPEPSVEPSVEPTEEDEMVEGYMNYMRSTGGGW